MKNLILRIALPTPLRQLFDYLPPQDIDNNKLIPGIRIKVPFGPRSLIGILISIENESEVAYEKLKPALELLDNEPILPPDVFQLCSWAADYYHYSMGEILSTALPTLLRKGKNLEKTISEKKEKIDDVIAPQYVLNESQQKSITEILATKNKFQSFLLDGVTGSGKTEVYLQVINALLAEQKQILVLIPEISLTPQTIERFRERFSQPVVALHSSLTEKQRLQSWLSARNGESKIVIGTRSAVFTPFANLGLIIVDEEHDQSFKQQDRFRYHARDLAVMRANINNVPIVLGSATPSLESLLNVKRCRYTYLSLPNRAGKAQLPQYKLLDLQHAQVEEGLSHELMQDMREHLKQHNQVMLFLNRRGFAPVLYCNQCRWIAGCARCDTRMVYHRSPKRLQCHHCDSQCSIPEHCEQCGMTELQPVGLGTQRLEQTLEKHFAGIPIIRVDRDNTRRKDSMQLLLDQINKEDKAILLGTQMLAKGHHFPRVTLVGVVDADAGLFSSDFRAAEQMGQLLLQVAGRAGRVEKPGTVIIQTRQPNHPLLQTLIQSGYASFAQNLLAEREQSKLPPYAYFAVFRAEAYAEKNANTFLNWIKSLLPTSNDNSNVFGPVPAIIAKKKGLYCQHLLLKAEKRSALQQTIKDLLQKIDNEAANHSVKWVLDIDPVEV